MTSLQMQIKDERELLGRMLVLAGIVNTELKKLLQFYGKLLSMRPDVLDVSSAYIHLYHRPVLSKQLECFQKPSLLLNAPAALIQTSFRALVAILLVALAAFDCGGVGRFGGIISDALALNTGEYLANLTLEIEID